MNNKNRFLSQQGEDIFIYNNFINVNTPDGIFVELGAMDGICYSNTYFFENTLGFKGVLIEPTKLYEKLKLNRPNSDCYNLAVSHNTEPVKILGNCATAGISALMSDAFKKAHHTNDINEYYVNAKPIRDILEESKIKYIDLLSIDVEGGELVVLNTIDWTIPIYVIVIELDKSNIEKDEKCREILKKNGFILYHRMCINEFWVNINYFRKNILWDANNIINNHDISNKSIFPYTEKHVITEINDSLNKYRFTI